MPSLCMQLYTCMHVSCIHVSSLGSRQEGREGERKEGRTGREGGRDEEGEGGREGRKEGGRKGGREGGREEKGRDSKHTCAASSMKICEKCPLGMPISARARDVLNVVTMIWCCRSSCSVGMASSPFSILE